MAIEAGGAEGAGGATKVPVAAIDGGQLGLVLAQDACLVRPIRRPHRAGDHKVRCCAADWTGPQRLGIADALLQRSSRHIRG